MESVKAGEEATKSSSFSNLFPGIMKTKGTAPRKKTGSVEGLNDLGAAKRSDRSVSLDNEETKTASDKNLRGASDITM